MEQFKQIGEVVGGLKALMVFREEIQINPRQCTLLLDILDLTYDSIADEMKHNLRFQEKQTKWRLIEPPLKELHRIFKEIDSYIRQCLEPKDWWVQAITFYQNKDCVELHVHNLLSCIPVVFDAIEMAGELAGWDPDEMQKRKLLYSIKYQKDCQDPKVFQWRFGKQYLVSAEMCNRLDSVWEEDRWVLNNKMIRRRSSGTKQDQQLSDVILKNLNESGILPSSILLNSKDYHLRRRLGSGKQYKEIQFRGESFILRHFSADFEALIPQISRESSLSHPNVTQFLCGFADEDKKECFLVMELMNRDLSTHIREISGSKKRLPFSLPVVVDLMMQIARGMEYLHSKGIRHGDLNPSNILVKPRNNSTDGYLHAKVSGFGLSSSISVTPTSQMTQNEGQSFIWHAPEVLAEDCKPTEKSDVYSFGMICFHLLTGKVPFEDNHLQGDKVGRNIRAGERPLFPFHPPKYLTNLTKRCWHGDPDQRPSFPSICRVLRSIKRFLLLNTDHSHSQPNSPTPMVDYCEIDVGFLKKFPFWGNSKVFPLSQIPFQMYAYRAAEKEKEKEKEKERSNGSQKEVVESGSEETDESIVVDDPIPEQKSLSRSSSSKTLTDTDNPIPERVPKRSMSSKRLSEVKVNNQSGSPS